MRKLALLDRLTIAVEAEGLVSSINGNRDRAPCGDCNLQRLQASGGNIHPTLFKEFLEVGPALPCYLIHVLDLSYFYFESNSGLVRPAIPILAEVGPVRVLCWNPAMG